MTISSSGKNQKSKFILNGELTSLERIVIMELNDHVSIITGSTRGIRYVEDVKTGRRLVDLAMEGNPF